MIYDIEDSEELNDQIAAAEGKLVVIDFYAQWCGPCKMIAPQMEALDSALSNVIFLKVDVDEAEDVAAEFGITAMPTFIFLKGGKQVDELMGANVDKLKELVEKNM